MLTKCGTCGQKFFGRIHCRTCGKLFYRKRPSQITCASKKCKKKRQLQVQRIWKAKNRKVIYPGEFVICKVCGQLVPKRASNQVTCWSKKCVKKLMNLHKFRGGKPEHVYRNLG